MWEEQANNIQQCASKGSGLPCTHTCKPNGCLMFLDFPKCARHLSLYVPVLLDAFPDLQSLDFWTWWEIGQLGSKATNASTTYKRPSEKAGIIGWCKWHQNTYFLPGHQLAADLLHGMHPLLALWFLLWIYCSSRVSDLMQLKQGLWNFTYPRQESKFIIFCLHYRQMNC